MSAPYIGGSPYWMFFQNAASIVAESPSAAAFAQRGPCCFSARSAASWNCFSFIFFFSMISTCSRARQRTEPTEQRGKMRRTESTAGSAAIAETIRRNRAWELWLVKFHCVMERLAVPEQPMFFSRMTPLLGHALPLPQGL